MCFTLALAYALALASISDVPNCGITYDRHYDDHNSFIIQATGFKERGVELAATFSNFKGRKFFAVSREK
jgi:hypothetical protein